MADEDHKRQHLVFSTETPRTGQNSGSVDKFSQTQERSSSSD